MIQKEMKYNLHYGKDFNLWIFSVQTVILFNVHVLVWLSQIHYLNSILDDRKI